MSFGLDYCELDWIGLTQDLVFVCKLIVASLCFKESSALCFREDSRNSNLSKLLLINWLPLLKLIYFFLEEQVLMIHDSKRM